MYPILRRAGHMRATTAKDEVLQREVLDWLKRTIASRLVGLSGAKRGKSVGSVPCSQQLRQQKVPTVVSEWEKQKNRRANRRSNGTASHLWRAVGIFLLVKQTLPACSRRTGGVLLK